MDGESIFYVIVAVVYFAVSIMNSRKKAKQKKQQKGKPQPINPNQQEPTPKEPTLEDLLGEFFGEEKKPVETAPSRPVAEPISNQEFMRQQELAEKARLAEERELKRRRNMIEHRKKMIEASIRTKSEAPVKMKGKIFGDVGLKEAIIAQTILERPYK